ncbi:hypothetical protein E4U15_004282, partial [Claviceps sp. LM218 group G6]
PRAEPRILNYFPIYQNADSTQEDYYARFDVEVYQRCQQHYSRHPYDYYGRIEEPEVTEADDEHGKEYTKQGQDVPREAWQELANFHPRIDPDGEAVQVLRNRDINLDARHPGRARRQLL